MLIFAGIATLVVRAAILGSFGYAAWLAYDHAAVRIARRRDVRTARRLGRSWQR